MTTSPSDGWRFVTSIPAGAYLREKSKRPPAPPAIEDTGHDGFYFEEVFGSPTQTGIGFAVSDL